MEEMLGEVEQMERVNLLEPKEVKELIKKRKHFEYKIQKKTKEKGDFLGYIQYETNLLSLLAMRRESTGYEHKKSEIEGAIRVRINKLFKILEHRFQSDVSVWLSHIHFLKSSGWEASVSRIYLRMLQVHSDKPGLWVAAAQWEFETLGNEDNGRQILLRGLRFLPTSWTLHREYLKLELIYVDKLKKRSEVLGGVGREKKEKDEGDEEEDEKDDVTDCAIVRLVAKAAVEAVNEPEFVVSLLATLHAYPFAASVEEEVMGLLQERHPGHHITVDTCARRELEKEGGSFKKRLDKCVERYTSALKEGHDMKLMNCAISTFRELLDTAPKLQHRIMKILLDLFRIGEEENLLSEEHFHFWLSCLDAGDSPELVTVVAVAAVKAHPASASLWVERLAVAAQTGDSKEVFNEALDKLHNEEAGLVRVWQAMLAMQSPVQGWQLVTGDLLDRNKPELRLLHLSQAADRGIESAREVYNSYRTLPPFYRGLHYQMATIEQEESKVSVPHLRVILDTLCDQFGSDDPLPWLARLKLEVASGKALEAAKIVCRAETALSGDLRQKFALLRDKEGV